MRASAFATTGVVDPEAASVRVFQERDGAFVEGTPLGPDDRLTGPLFPGVDIALDEVFSA